MGDGESGSQKFIFEDRSTGRASSKQHNLSKTAMEILEQEQMIKNFENYGPFDQAENHQ